MLVQYKDKVKLWKEKGKENNVKGCANGRSSFFTKQRKELEAMIEAATNHDNICMFFYVVCFTFFFP